MAVVAVAGLVLWVVIWSVCLLGLYIARTRFTVENLSAPSDKHLTCPPVSILRPLRGLDVNLFENLQSSFEQDYPQFEIIFSVAAADDPAIPYVKQLIERYPHVEASLIIGEETVGINPKINNLIQSYSTAKYDHLWILDSNVLCGRSTLSKIMPHFENRTRSGKRIGMLHHLPFPIYPDKMLGSRLEYAFLSMTHAKMYLAINACQIDSCIVGKSNLYRRSDVEQTKVALKAGKGLNRGLTAYGRYLGEDNMIGHALWHDLDLRHAMNADVIGNAVGSMTFSTYFWRRVRWIRVRKYMVTFVSQPAQQKEADCYECIDPD